MELNLKIIESFNLEQETYRPDYDDAGYKFTLPKSGIQVSCLYMCNHESCDVDTLYGLDDWLIIETEEQLREYIDMEYEDILNKVKEEDSNFDIDKYLDE